MGVFKFDLLSFSERIFILENRIFFKRLETHLFKNRSINKTNLLFQSKFRSILVTDEVSVSFVNYLLDFHDNKLTPSKKKHHTKIISEKLIIKDVSIKELFLLSTLYSKISHFSLALKCEEIAIHELLIINRGSLFEYFQKIKSIFYFDTASFENKLKKLMIFTYIKKNYKFFTILNLINTKTEKGNPVIPLTTILGPLRTKNAIKDHQESELVIIKPNSIEIEYAKNISTKRIILYSFDPIKGYTRNFNVVDYHFNRKNLLDKYTGPTTDFFSQFMLINGYPQHLQRALIDQLTNRNALLINIEEVSFYLSDKLYSAEYIYPHKGVNELTLSERKKMLWNMGWHSLIANYRFVKFLDLHNLIISTEEVGSIIKLTIEDYARELELKYNLMDL